ncbi:methylamine utilization protein MauJ [Paracoccus sp. NGMCC 1.201697]|uniref:Methylamine utilization protein MauJ n=1 Tax=Paracoccus broussonetiae subsp. drimophilus TaxID=3373869 RepID=A0ABW7LKL8_9RHOB
MWIPYDIRASLKAESPPDAVRQSLADADQREFLVGFFLRNPVTQIWEADISVDGAPTELSAGPDLPDARVSFHGNEAGKLSEVIYRLQAASHEQALAQAHGDVQRRLLRWMAEIGRGMAIAGWRIADPRHGARWRCTPFRPSAMRADHIPLGPVAADLAPVVELFQRARNAPDAASRLMAAFAVLDLAATHPALSRADAAGFRVTQDMLIHSGALASPEPLQGMELDALIAHLRPHHDRLIGPRGVLAPVLDDLAGQRRLAMMANLADLAAHRLILAELRARREAARAPQGAAGA